MLLSVLMVFSFSIPAFAEVDSYNFSLDKKDGAGTTGYTVMRYLIVDAKGSVEFSISNMTNQNWDMYITLYDSEGQVARTLLTEKNKSGKFKNLKGGEYSLSVSNATNLKQKGTLNYSWTGKWGEAIN